MATRSVPQPPFSTELLADLHADNVAPELRQQLWPAVRNDPDALRFVHSLDDVNAELRTLRDSDQLIHAMPADIVARLEQFVEGLDSNTEPDEPVATMHALPFATAPENTTAPTASDAEPTTHPIRLDDHRPRRLRWLAAAAAVFAAVACVGIVVNTVRDRDATPSAQPTTGDVALGDDLNATVALSVLGRNDVTGRLGTPAAIGRCVQANGLDRAVLGSTNTTFQGKDAVLILLAGPRPHKITALVVGVGCTTNDPQQLTIADIG